MVAVVVLLLLYYHSARLVVLCVVLAMAEGEEEEFGPLLLLLHTAHVAAHAAATPLGASTVRSTREQSGSYCIVAYSTPSALATTAGVLPPASSTSY